MPLKAFSTLNHFCCSSYLLVVNMHPCTWKQLKNNFKMTMEWKIVDENTLGWRTNRVCLMKSPHNLACKTSLKQPLFTKTTQYSCVLVVYKLHKRPFQMFIVPRQRVGAASPCTIDILIHSKMPCHRPHKQFLLMNF
jgi:hypothetical protein